LITMAIGSADIRGLLELPLTMSDVSWIAFNVLSRVTSGLARGRASLGCN
jgi:hypothetical protein